MRRALFAAAIALAACNQRDSSQAKSAPPAPAPAPAPRVVTAPPDAAPDVYEVEVEKPTIANEPSAVAPPDARKPGAHDDEAAMEAEAAKYADLLTGEGPNGSDVADMDSRRRPGADLDQQINDVKHSGAQVELGGGVGRGSRGDGDPRVGIGSASSDPAPAGRISVSSKQALDDSSLTPDFVLAKVMQVYMPAIKRCYRDVLKQDPTARGKVVLKLTVSETGRAIGATADSFDDSLTACCASAMSSWRFPVPKDADGDATAATFAITLQLVPQ